MLIIKNMRMYICVNDTVAASLLDDGKKHNEPPLVSWQYVTRNEINADRAIAEHAVIMVARAEIK